MDKKTGLYAVLGGIVGAIITLAVCSVMPIGAQNGDATFGGITCTGLTVVDADGIPKVELSFTEYGGAVSVYEKGYPDKETFSMASMLMAKNGGQLSLWRGSGENAKWGGGWEIPFDAPSMQITLGNTGGSVGVWGASGSAVMKVDEHGGVVHAFGKGDDNARVSMGVNEYGNGAVGTRDKNGYRLATLK